MKTRVKLSFLLILTLALMLTMAQTAWAGTTIETRTVTWKMDKDGRDVFLADSGYVLSMAQQDFEHIKFHFTSEF